jgi:hypothetical protein
MQHHFLQWWWCSRKGERMDIESFEEWEPIKGYEGIYEVSDFGRIRSYKNNKHGLREEPTILNGLPGKHYKTVVLCKENKKKTHYVHRLVAETFLEKPDGKNFVNHIDGNKHNNFAVNLEWCSHADNMHHASVNDIGGFGRKKVACVEYAIIYKSVTEAAQKTGISRRSISNCLCGRCKTAGKKHWRCVD